ncbi:MAG: biotin/lipoyl-containing protein [Oscillospiraceae bacterium]
MKRFNITVNGKAYDVAVEEVSGGAAPVAAAPVAAAPAPVAAPAAAPAAGTPVTAPMPGTILDVKVSVGTEVKEGQPVAVLEAMKMENDVPAAATGKVVAISVKKGDSVQTGDVILTIA